MDFGEFKEKTKEEMEKRLGNGKAKIQETIKNNSVKRMGLFVEKPGADISPVIYLEEHYEKLCRGQGFAETMDEIWALYLRHAGDRPFEPAEFSDWGRAEEKVFVRLVHYGNNERRLKDMPHERFLDLAEVYYYEEGTKGGPAQVQIKNIHLEAWGICRKELKAAAYRNYKTSGGTFIRRLDDAIREMSGIALEEDAGGMRLYVVSNRRGQGGAAAMLFAETFLELAERLGSDLYILPSSIHEVLLLPVSMGTPEELAGIVKEVNRTLVLPEERLSDRVYRYDRESGKVRIA